MATALASAYVAHPDQAPNTVYVNPQQQFAPPTTPYTPPPQNQTVAYGVQAQPAYPAYPQPGTPLANPAVNLDPEAQKDNAELEAFLKDLTIKDRMVFLRKVYMILFFQLAVTAVVIAIMLYSSTSWQIWLWQNSWFPWVLFVACIVSLLGCYAKRKHYPINMVMICIFTGFQAVSIGSICVFYSANIVLNAWISATFVFIGLSLYALQTKKDFTGAYPFLAACLMVVLITGLMQLFLPYNSWTQVMIALFTGILFAAYIVVDTQTIFRRFHKDDAIPASIMLYLDFINLFLALLRVIGASQR